MSPSLPEELVDCTLKCHKKANNNGPSTAGWSFNSRVGTTIRKTGTAAHHGTTTPPPTGAYKKAAPWKHDWLKQPGQFAFWKGGNSQGISTVWIRKETRGMLVMRRRRRSGGEWRWWDFFWTVSSEDSSEDSPEDFPETKSSQENPQKNPQNGKNSVLLEFFFDYVE